jgi:hypothetical protein
MKKQTHDRKHIYGKIEGKPSFIPLPFTHMKEVHSSPHKSPQFLEVLLMKHGMLPSFSPQV